MWVRFTERFAWRPNHGTTIVYPPKVYNVTRECAAAAMAAGKAVRARKVRKDEEPVDGDEA